MSASDVLFAVMLLSAPIGTPEQTPTADRWPTVQAALHQTAVDWEILDARETRYVLAKREDFQVDLDFLRKRKAELAEAPNVIDSFRLPDRQMINDAIRFNRSFGKQLDLRILWEADRAGLIREVISENERLYRMWDAMRDAKSDLHYITTRRLALLRLRDQLGPDAYEKNELPPYVPDWRFARLP
jgi:hypothetical protein